jgi:hypothetical protein
MSMPTPQAVSAFLGGLYHRHSKGHAMRHEGGWVPIYPGFEVTRGYGLPGQVRHVAVRYVLGSRDETLPPGKQKELTREWLERYRERLMERYQVTVGEDEAGAWEVLLVWSRDEDLSALFDKSGD